MLNTEGYRKSTVPQRRNALAGFNEITLMQGMYPVDASYDYMCDNLHMSERTNPYVDLVLELATKPFIVSGMGDVKFIHDIYGLSVEDLLRMDLISLDRMDKKLTELSEMLKPKEPPPKEPPMGNLDKM